MALKCEHCGVETETEIELEVEHRACRLKAAFPGAYTERQDGLVTFDMKKVAERLGLFSDWVIDTKGNRIHPLHGSLHFRIGTSWNEAMVWIELPVHIGNQLSSWAFEIKAADWRRLVKIVEAGLHAAELHLQTRREGDNA